MNEYRIYTKINELHRHQVSRYISKYFSNFTLLKTVIHRQLIIEIICDPDYKVNVLKIASWIKSIFEEDLTVTEKPANILEI